MSYIQRNFNATNGRNNSINQMSLRNYNCQLCKKYVIAKDNIWCDHPLCDSCCEKMQCPVCKPIYRNSSELRAPESFSVPNTTLLNETNEFNGCNLYNEGKHSRELVPQPVSKISPQLPNYFQESRKESQQLTFPSPPFVSSTFNDSYVLPEMSTLSVESSSSDSPPNYDYHDGVNKKKILASSMHFSPQSENQNSKSQRYLSHNGLHYQIEPTDYNHVDSLQLCDQQSCSISNLSNLPTLPSRYSPRYVANNDIQTQYIPNNLEVEEIEVLKDVNISECGHEKSEWFCQPCSHIFCYKCRENHKHHKYCRISDAIEYYGNFSKSILQNISQIDDTINHSILKIENEKSKLQKNFQHFEAQIKHHNEELNKELLKREKSLEDDVNHIGNFKISRLESQLRGNFPDNFMISSFESQLEDKNAEQEYKPLYEISDIYLDHSNENACSDLIKEFGLMFGSASNEKTVVSGIGLSTIIIDHPCGFIVQCYDILKNKCFIGGEDIKATLIYPNERNCNVPIIDLMNGFYQGFVNTKVEGNHRLRITLRGNLISEREYILKSKPYKSLETVIKNSNSYSILKQTRKYWRDIHCDENGRVFITDSTSHKFHIYDHEHKLLESVGNQGVGNGEFQKPYGITVDKEKRIIVVDSGNHRVQVFSYDGEFIFTFGSIGSDKSYFKFPEGVATNSEGYIAVSDKGNNRIQLFDRNGTFIAVTKSRSNSRSIERPHGLCFEKDDILLVSCSESQNMAIVKYRLTLYSDKIEFERDYEPIYIGNNGLHCSNNQIRDPLGLIQSNDYYILTSSSKIQEKGGIVYFYNKRMQTKEELWFHNQTPYSVAVSPEGCLYVIVLNHLNSETELHMYTGNQ